MRKCVIFFAVLLIALLIAVWTDSKRDLISGDGVALEASTPNVSLASKDSP